MFKGIDLFSDTMTRPSPGMLQAMITAELGDEQRGEDPTTRALEEKVAELLGKESALFMPSATMASEIAIKALCEPGDELLAAENCHLFVAEGGGPAVHASVMAKPIRVPNGIFTPEQLKETFNWAKAHHYPISRLLSIENTTNMGGGVAWPIDSLKKVLKTAKEIGLRTHLDGARLFNAAVRNGVAPKEIASGFDMVTICLSKGLGCPVGAVLAFDKSQWEKIRRLKQLMGGALRQSGVLAAAGLYALEHNIARLDEDHKNAQLLASRLSDIGGIDVEDRTPSTNMVFFRWQKGLACEQFLERCTNQGVRFSHVGINRVRAVTHLDVKTADIERAAQIVRSICDEAS